MKMYIPQRQPHAIAQNNIAKAPIAMGPNTTNKYAVAIELNINADIMSTARMASTIRACIIWPLFNPSC